MYVYVKYKHIAKKAYSQRLLRYSTCVYKLLLSCVA